MKLMKPKRQYCQNIIVGKKHMRSINPILSRRLQPNFDLASFSIIGQNEMETQTFESEKTEIYELP